MPKAKSGPLLSYKVATGFVTKLFGGNYACSICDFVSSSIHIQCTIKHVRSLHRDLVVPQSPSKTPDTIHKRASISCSKGRKNVGVTTRKRPATSSGKHVTPTPPSEPEQEVDTSESEQEVDKIVGQRIEKGKQQYAVLWIAPDETGQPDVTWEPLEHLWNSRDKLVSFLQNYGQTLVMDQPKQHLSVLTNTSKTNDRPKNRAQSLQGLAVSSQGVHQYSVLKKRPASTSRSEPEQKKSRSGSSQLAFPQLGSSKSVNFDPLKPRRAQSSSSTRKDVSKEKHSSSVQTADDMRIAKKASRSGRDGARPSSSSDVRPARSAKFPFASEPKPSGARASTMSHPLASRTACSKTDKLPSKLRIRPKSSFTERKDPTIGRPSFPGYTSRLSRTVNSMVPARRIHSSFGERCKALKDRAIALQQKASQASIPIQSLEQSRLITFRSVGHLSEDRPTNQREMSLEYVERPHSMASEVPRLLTSPTIIDSEARIESRCDEQESAIVSNQKPIETFPIGPKSGNVVWANTETVPGEVAVSESEPEDDYDYDEFIIQDPVKLNRQSGFSLGMIPEKILGIIRGSAPVKYVVKWKGNRVAEPVDSDILLQEIPKMLIAFLEARIVDL